MDFREGMLGEKSWARESALSDCATLRKAQKSAQPSARDSSDRSSHPSPKQRHA